MGEDAETYDGDHLMIDVIGATALFFLRAPNPNSISHCLLCRIPDTVGFCLDA